MPAPETVEEFLELIRKSGVVDERKLSAYVQRLREAGQLPSQPVRLATQFVAGGVLTQFQAEQFLQGKWRRFTIGKYKVLERLGSGGMGSVYLCEHTLMRRRVALKVLPTNRANDPSALERFYREARAVAALDHPNIVRAYDIDNEDNLHFLVMEHVDGSSLQEIIKKTGPMDVLRAAHYIYQSALGLQHAHETAGLVHRDIKPGNILVDRNGVVKILDMGLARFFHDEDDDLTKKHDENVLGTADYLSPEQALDSHGADIRADIYSLGGTFYYCLTGSPPFPEGTIAQKVIWHQTRHPRPISELRTDVPGAIIDIVRRMMAKAPQHRFQTPLEVAEALEPWTRTPIPPPPEVEMPQLSLAATRNLTGLGDSSTGTSISQVRSTDPVSPRPQTSPPLTSPRPVPKTKPPSQPVIALPPPPPVSPPSVGRTAAPVAPPVQGSQSKTVPPLPGSSPPLRSGATAELVLPGTGTNNAIPAPPATTPQSASPTQDLDLELQQIPPAIAGVSTEDLAEDVSVKRPPTRRVDRSIRGSRSPFFWIGVVAGALLIAGGGLLVLSLLLERNPQGKKNGTGPIRVPGPLYKTLREAITNCRENERIVLTDHVMEIDVALSRSHISIEGEPGKTILWKCPPGKDAGAKLLRINNAAGCKVSGILFDGQDVLDNLILVHGDNPGLQLANLILRGARNRLLHVCNAAGTPDNPIRLTNIQFATTKPDQTAIRFDIFSSLAVTGPKVNRHLVIQGGLFDGPGLAVSLGADSDLDRSTIQWPALTVQVRPDPNRK